MILNFKKGMIELQKGVITSNLESLYYNAYLRF